MKARVKLTGKIVDVVVKEIPQYGFLGECTGPVEYRITRFYDGENYYRYDELDFEVETFIYWEKLEHQYAGMAMQSYVSNNVYLREIREMCKEPQEMRDLIADLSILLAATLVQKLKEKEERK